MGLNKKTKTKASSAQVSRPAPKLARPIISVQNCNQNTHQQSFSAFIHDLVESQEVVEMELEEKTKEKKLRRIKRLAPKSSYRKRKKLMKVRSMQLMLVSDGAPHLLAMEVTNT